MRFCYYLLLQFVFVLYSYASEVTLKKKDAVVWSHTQIINGEVDFTASNGILYLNSEPNIFSVVSNSFSVELNLREGINEIYAEVNDSSGTVVSDTLFLTVDFKIKPEVYAYISVEGSNVVLHSEIVENPEQKILTYFWNQDAKNPVLGEISDQSFPFTSVIYNNGLITGEYYFDLYVVDTDNDTSKARTYFTYNDSTIIPFNIKTDYASWIDSAVVYCITPYIFTYFNQYVNIKNKMPELRNMGINTIWIQPVFGTHGGGQGYDITNYFGLRNDLGTEAELKELISTAKSLGMKVLFDFVANHSSNQHPYYKDAIQYGEDSHYYNFYKHSDDNAPYSQHYNKNSHGFYYYFWTDLIMFNYDNPEVWNWMIEAAKYWIDKYDIDGYRFDAIWGVTARAPEFTKQLRLALKRIKPEVFLLAEDKATWSETFDERFDAAYDWAPEESWVSHWVWNTFYSENSNPTIFNQGSESSRPGMLRNSLSNFGNGYSSNAKILRFMENNDVFHFITHHSIEQTKMAASLMFSLNGIPLIYNGQETGLSGHPYSTERTFIPGISIEGQSQYGLFNYYKRLIEIRKNFTALITENFEEVNLSGSNTCFAFRRWNENQNLFTVINVGKNAANIKLSFPVDELNLNPDTLYYLTDLMSGESFTATANDLTNLTIPVQGYITRILHLADSIDTVVGVDEIEQKLPTDLELAQNYPNPFNPSTKIKYMLPDAGYVKLKIYDLLGREVQTLVNKFEYAGTHYTEFNASNFASGIYFYRIEFEGNVITKKMILVK